MTKEIRMTKSEDRKSYDEAAGISDRLREPADDGPADNGPGDDIVAVEVDSRIQLECSPGTAGQLAQEFPIVAEEDSQSFWDGENHLAVRDLFEQLFAGPMGPYELTFFVATRTKADLLCGLPEEAPRGARNQNPNRARTQTGLERCR